MKQNRPGTNYPWGVLLLVLSQALWVNPSWSATFCVGNSAELRSALLDSRNNGEDDQIRLRSGTYFSSEGFGFVTDLEPDRSLAMTGGWFDLSGTPCAGQTGSGPLDTVIDGEDQTSGLVFNAHGFGSTASLLIRKLSVIQGSSSNSQSGIRISGTPGFDGDILIDRVRFAGNDGGDGAALTARGGNKVTIRNSVFQFNRTSSAGGTIYFVMQAQDKGVYFINNTVIDNRSDFTGISTSATSGMIIELNQSGDDIPQALVANNLFWSNDQADMFFSAKGGIKHVFNNNYEDRRGVVQFSNNNLSLPPQLNPLLLNYTPEEESPLIDQGLAAPALRGGPFLLDWGYGVVDFDGGVIGRVFGDRVDIGAVESSFRDSVFSDRFESP